MRPDRFAAVSFAVARPLDLPAWSWLVICGEKRRGGMVRTRDLAELMAEAAWALLAK